MSDMYAGTQLIPAVPIAGREAKPEDRRANHCDAGDRGIQRIHEHDKEAPRTFLLTMLRALGAMHT